MLNKIRKAADSFIMRILLGMIAFAFIGWGSTNIFQSNNNPNLVTFSDAKNISEEDFLKAKAEQLTIIQRQTGTNLTEEEIKQLNIDNIIVKKLINNNMLNYLVKYYDLDITDDTVIQLVKKSPNFKNDKGLFDIIIFKSFLKNSYINEEHYLSSVKEHSLKNTIISIFLESFPTPEIMVKNIIDYMAETRNVDLVQIDLEKRSKNLRIPKPTADQLEDFYENNQQLFKIPEKRSLSYVKISSETLPKQIDNNDQELLDFYHENKEEFGDKSYIEVQKQVNELLEQQKIERYNVLLAKNLEDDVASGLSLKEIAEKYQLTIENIDYISYQDLSNNRTDISQNADNIFELTEGELSYPIELVDKKTFILVEIKSIQASEIQEFVVIKDQAQKLWANQQVRKLNLKIIENIAKEYQPNKKMNFPEVSIDQSASFLRSEIQNNKQLPIELLLVIFQTNIGSNSPVFQLKDKAYFAHIKSIKIDRIKAQEIEKNNKEDIINAIKNNVIDELINYAIKKNKISYSQIPVNNSK